MIYNMIVAFDINNGIGKDNKIPWYISDDLKRFSKLTRAEGNNAIIMGRNTWESLPKKPLIKRDNLILSTTLNIEENSPKNTLVKSFNNIQDIYLFCEKQDYDTVWIIGGSKIYEHFIDDKCLNNIYVTFVLKEYNCDRYFPALSEWKLTDNEYKIITDDLAVYYQIYTR